MPFMKMVGAPSKILLLLRHAYAFAPEAHVEDASRQLTEKGLAAATKLGMYWHEQGIHFDKIVSSPTIRTVSTAKTIASAMGCAHEVIAFNDLLHEGTVEDVIAYMQTWNAAWHQVLVVSHKPLLIDLLAYLAGKAILQIPTCGYIVVGFKLASWHELTKSIGQIVTSGDCEKL